jgi:hypothetical protein
MRVKIHPFLETKGLPLEAKKELKDRARQIILTDLQAHQ